MGTTATLVHMLLWNYNDVSLGWQFLNWQNLKKLLIPSTWMFWKGGETKEEQKIRILADESYDPHYKLMADYDEVPQWWYGLVLFGSFVVGLGTLYGVSSTLPWWGYIIALLISAIFILFFGAQYAITGFQFNQQPVLQMLGGYLHPGKPLGMLKT